MPRHFLPWVLAASLAAIGFQALQNRVVSVPDNTPVARTEPAPAELDRANYSF